LLRFNNNIWIKVLFLLSIIYINIMEQSTVQLNIDVLKKVLDENNEIFDNREIDERFLPQNVDVLGYIYMIRKEKGYHASFNDCYSIAAKKVIEMWEKTKIPIVQYKAVKSKMVKLMEVYQKTKQKIHRGKCGAIDLKFLNEFFSISSCK
jgi:hypothetical protein